MMKPMMHHRALAFAFLESIVHAIDRQIISSGLLLIMFLPAFGAFTYFASWAFSQSSPIFWQDNIEPNLGMGFSTFMASLRLSLSLATSSLSGFTAIALASHWTPFTRGSKYSNIEHRSVQSLQGYDDSYQLQSSMMHHTKSPIFAISSCVMLIAVLWYGTGTVFGNLFLLASASFLILFNGSTPSHTFDSVQHGGANWTSPRLHTSRSPLNPEHGFQRPHQTHMDPLTFAVR